MAEPTRPVSETHPWATLGFRLLALGGLVPVAAKGIEKLWPGFAASIPLAVVAVLIASLVILPLFLMVNRFREIGREAKARQQARDAAAQQIAASLQSPWVSVPPFAFYVRPFFADDRFAWETTDIGGDDAVRYGFRVAMEDMLARAIEPALPLVALSGSGIGFGPGEIASADADWKKKALLLMERAQVIFAVPFAQPSTLTEIQTILGSSLVAKTIFVVPPLYRPPLGSGAITESFLGRKAHPLEIYRASHTILAQYAPDFPMLSKPGGIFWRDAGAWQVHHFRNREACTAEAMQALFASHPRMVALPA
jgi:hypothetical protein